MKNSDGFPQYDYLYYGVKAESSIGGTSKVRSPKARTFMTRVNRSTQSKTDGWLPPNKVGYLIDNMLQPKNKHEMCVMLEYFNMHRNSVPDVGKGTFISKTGGTIVPNNGYYRNSDCCTLDTNVCGIISFFGKEYLKSICVCKLRALLRTLVDNTSEELIIGTKKNQTLSEDHLDLLGRYFAIRVFILQDYKGKLSILDLGDPHSSEVKFITSNGSHFEEVVYDD